MVNLKRLLLPAVLAIVTTAAIADVKAELKPMYEKFNTAMKAKNVKAVMDLCTADFTWMDAKGNAISRTQMEDQLKAQMQFVKTVNKMTFKIEKVNVKGKEFIAHTSGVFEATVQLPDGKKTSKLKSVSVTEDTWVKIGGKWMLKRVKSIKDTTTLDGKSFSGG